MKFCKSLCFSVSCILIFTAAAFSQQRPRVVANAPQLESQPLNQPPNKPIQRPALTNQIVVQNSPALVKKTVSSQPINVISGINTVGDYNASFSQKLLKAIQIRVGVPYLYGSSGPNTYDCSGLVWSAFFEAGFRFERTSAKSLWQNSVPVEGDDRYKFGTLVFFNKLGHIGIVFNDSGFYHASSSRGVTYSRFDDYWTKRIVGYRRIQIGK